MFKKVKNSQPNSKLTDSYKKVYVNLTNSKQRITIPVGQYLSKTNIEINKTHVSVENISNGEIILYKQQDH